jgi:putative Mn2+ efflux pump MntP
MDWFTLLGIAVGLAMDAFAVAVGVSSALKDVSRRQYFRLSWHFGLFQALMPLLGWLLGRFAAGIVEAIDHWIAFAILALLGIKMILEALKPSEDKKMPIDPTRGMTLILLSLATSIDAFAVGLSLALLGTEIFTAAAVIGVVACVMTLVGMRFGKFLGRWIGSGAEIFGGVVLIFLGVKFLLEQL